MLDLLTKREEIQSRATLELGRRFHEYDINCIAVLIGRPESKVPGTAAAPDPIEALFDQLRVRRLSQEQIATYAKQEEAATQLKKLNDARSAAEKQTELTQTRIDIEISGNRGEAQLAESQRLAKRDIARAVGESRSRELVGRGEASRVAQVGMAEASVFLQKIRAYGDPRIFALSLVSEQFARSAQPIVPERLLVMGGGGEGAKAGSMDLGSANVFSRLITLLLAEKGGIAFDEKNPGLQELQKYADELARRSREAPPTVTENATELEAEMKTQLEKDGR